MYKDDILEKYSGTELNTLQSIVGQYDDIEILNEAMIWAASQPDAISVLQKLIDKGAEITEEKGNVALIMACDFLQFENVRFLLDNGASLNGVDENGCTPMHFVCDQDIMICKNVYQMIFDNIQKNEPCNFDGRFYPEHYKIIRLLLEKGADAMVSDLEGITPLFQMVRSSIIDDDIEAVNYLIDKMKEVSQSLHFSDDHVKELENIASGNESSEMQTLLTENHTILTG